MPSDTRDAWCRLSIHHGGTVRARERFTGTPRVRRYGTATGRIDSPRRAELGTDVTDITIPASRVVDVSRVADVSVVDVVSPRRAGVGDGSGTARGEVAHAAASMQTESSGTIGRSMNTSSKCGAPYRKASAFPPSAGEHAMWCGHGTKIPARQGLSPPAVIRRRASLPRPPGRDTLDTPRLVP